MWMDRWMMGGTPTSRILSLRLVARWIATAVLPADPLRAVLVQWLFLPLPVANDALIVLFALVRLVLMFACFRHLPFLQQSIVSTAFGRPCSAQRPREPKGDFLPAFPDGEFSEDSTFAIADLFAHTDKEALAKIFSVEPKAFDHVPTGELFIFQAEPPPPLEQDAVTDPQGQVSQNMVFKMMDQAPATSPGGSVRIADTHNFPISTDVAAAHVEVAPGHMREIHWHPNADEWQYYVSSKARMTAFAAEAKARTFNFQAGDVGDVPMSMSHFIENIGDEPLRFLELFKSPRYMDVSLAQRMALTPHELVRAHLNLDSAMVDGLAKDKRPVISAAIGPARSGVSAA
jgi:oxalate decarboxylase